MATRTWNGGGGDDNWSTAANWGGTAPVAGDDLIFAGTTRLTPNNDIAADTSFASITFDNTAGAFVIGGNRITLTGNITDNDTDLQTINLNIILNVATCTITTVVTGLTINGVISETGGARALTKAGAGGLTLTGLNTYTGATSVQAGTLSFNTIQNVSGGASSLGNPTTTGNGTIALGSTTTTGTLVYTGSGHSTNRVINLAGTTGGGTITQSGSGTLTFSSAFTATGSGAKTLTLNGSTASAGVISGAIVNSASATSVTKDGTGTWTLSAANTYTGTTTVTNGVLRAGASTTVFGSNSAVTVANTVGAILDLNTFNVSIGSLACSGSLGVVDTVAGGASTLTVGGNNTNTTFAGVAKNTSGTLSIAKTGAGVLTLSGTNTYTGATTISAGTLLVNGSIAAGSAVTVNTGGTLGGSGTVNGAITVNGGTVTPGSATGVSIGTLNTAAVTFSSGQYAVDLNGTTPTFDQINSSGTVALGAGVATLAVANIASAAAGRTYTIITAASVTGTFGSLGNGSLFTQQSRTFQIVYTATTVTLLDVTGVALTTKVWDGGGADNNWTTAANWVGDVRPLPGDAIQFAGSARLSPVNDFATDTGFPSITFNSGAGAFTLTGNRVYLTGTSTSITNNSTTLQTVNLALVNSWTPASVATRAWYDATDAATITQSGGLVSQWNDKSGNGQNLTQGTGSLQPATGTHTIGGLNAIRFNLDWMRRDSFSLTGSTAQVLCVQSFDSSSNSSARIVSMWGGVSQDWDGAGSFVYSRAGASALVDSFRNSNGVNNGSGTAYNTPFIGGAIFDAVNTIVDANGTVTTGPASTGAFTGSRLTIGTNDRAAGELLVGSIGEIVLLTDVSLAVRQRIEGYLANKWGLTGSLPASHPYKTASTVSTVTVNAASGDIVLGGILSGTGGWTKTGSGVVTLSAVNTYTGATTVSAGELRVTGSLASGSAVAVNSGGVLSGSGTVAGTVAINAGGSMFPGVGGNSIATLNTGAVTFKATATFNVNLSGTGPTADRVTSTGVVTCAGTLTPTVLAPVPSRVYTIASGSSVTGTFSGLANGATLVASGRTLRINYTATSVTLTDISPLFASTMMPVAQLPF